MTNAIQKQNPNYNYCLRLIEVHISFFQELGNHCRVLSKSHCHDEPWEQRNSVKEGSWYQTLWLPIYGLVTFMKQKLPVEQGHRHSEKKEFFNKQYLG